MLHQCYAAASAQNCKQRNRDTAHMSSTCVTQYELRIHMSTLPGTLRPVSSGTCMVWQGPCVHTSTKVGTLRSSCAARSNSCDAVSAVKTCLIGVSFRVAASSRADSSRANSTVNTAGSSRASAPAAFIRSVYEAHYTEMINIQCM